MLPQIFSQPAPDATRSAHLLAFLQLREAGQMHDAAAHLARALEMRASVALPFRGTVPVARVLVLQSILAGNVLMHRFLDDRLFAAHILLVEFWQPGTPLPAHDLVFNAIGDADVRSEALAQAERILACTAAPVLNPPSAVRHTTRVGNADRLSLLPGIRAARTALVQRSELRADSLEKMLERNGLRLPILLRAPGFHMGQNCIRLDRLDDLPSALENLPGDELLLLEYLNARSPDGWCRKYRILFLNGQMYPVHLAVSSHWKVHYFSAEMAANAAHRAEDERFLSDIDATLGCAVLSALERIQRILALDYGGVDFSLDEAGRVLLFEANANMAVLRPPDDQQWHYRRPAVDRIFKGFQRMLVERSQPTWPVDALTPARDAVAARC